MAAIIAPASPSQRQAQHADATHAKKTSIGVGATQDSIASAEGAVSRQKTHQYEFSQADLVNTYNIKMTSALRARMINLSITSATNLDETQLESVMHAAVDATRGAKNKFKKLDELGVRFTVDGLGQTVVYPDSF